jgi:hypothetical protein
MTIVRAVTYIVLPALVASLAPTRALAADCGAERTADQIFAHPYGEPPSGPCPVENAPVDKDRDREHGEHENVLADERGPRQLRTIGVSGLEGGASIAAIGGLIFLASIFLNEGTKGERALHWGGIGLASFGGALFLTGGILVGIDMIMAPAVTPDHKGAEMLVAFRF